EDMRLLIITCQKLARFDMISYSRLTQYSMVVLLKGRIREESFWIGKVVTSEISAMSPIPVPLMLKPFKQFAEIYQNMPE
ncbi:hypothetical protein ABKV19_008828, partial [Rosa sericea]